MKTQDMPFGDFATFKYGKMPVKSRVSASGKYPLYSGYRYVGFYDEYNTDENTLVIVARGVGGTGKVKLTKERCYLTNLSIAASVNEKIALPQYLYYYFSVHDLRYLDSGSAQSQITITDLSKVTVSLPPLEEQQKVCAILGALDDKIALNQRINNNLEQQAQAMFTSWFMDYDIFDEPFCESPIGTFIPESLKMVQIASLQPILETGKRPKGGAASIGIPSIGAENVKKLGEMNLSSNKFIPFEFASKLKTGKVNGYELMLYKDGGKPGTFTPHFSMFGEGFPYDEFYINEHVFKLDFGNRGFNEFAYFYFQTDYPYNWLANNGGKAAIPGINRQDVNSIWIYSPEHPIVKRYCEWVQPIFTTILSNCAQNVKLAAVRDTLLPRLMSGELDISGLDL